MKLSTPSSLRTQRDQVCVTGFSKKSSTSHKSRFLSVIRAAGSSYGHMFRITTFGESHGGGVGCVVDGVPARLNITQVS